MDEELLLARIIAGIEGGGGGDDESHYHELVADLKFLLETDDDEILDRFYVSLSSTASPFLRCFSAAMDSPVESGRLAISASEAYLSLLLSTNCPVFTLFSPVAFLSLLGSIRRYLKPRHREDSGAASQGNKKKRGRGGGSRKNARNPGREDGDETEEGGLDAKLVFRVLERLGSVLGFVHLDRFPDSLKSLVQTVSEIPLLALEHSGVLNYDRLMEMCGRILGGVLSSDHGDVSLTAAEISKSLTPLLLMGKHQARSFALGFVSRKIMGLAKDNSELKKVVCNLPKFLVHKAPEKAEPRGFAVEAILEIVKAMEVEDQSEFVDFVMKMGQGKSNLRILAVDLIPLLMSSLGNSFGSISSEDGVEDSWGLGCLNALVQRCSDSSALIRARALSNLAQVVGFLSGDERSRSILKQALGFTGCETSEGKGRITDLLKKRCVDEKAATRRAALLLVTKLTSLLGGCFDVSILKTMGTSCSDPLISIRKAAISALSEAFRICTDEVVTTEWLHSVPRMVMDNETSIQEECENVFHELVLERISRAGNSLSQGSASLPDNWSSSSKDLDRDIEALFPEGVLVLLRELCNSEVSPWVKKICVSLGKKKQLKPRVALALQSIIKESESLWLNRSMPINKWTAPAGAWFLLSEVSVFLPKSVEWEFLHHHWQLLDKNDLQEGTDGQGDEEGVECNSSTWAGDRVFLLQTISNVSLQLPPEPAADLADNLLKKIEKFNLHSAEVDAHVKALKTLCVKKARIPEESDVLVKKWVEQVLSKASKVTEKYIEGISSNNLSFATPAMLGSRRSKKLDSVSKKLSKAITAVYTIGSCVIIYPSADTTKIVPLLHTVITSGSADSKLKNKLPQANACLKQKAPPLYSQSWLTMAKICLADGKLAKRYIPLFAQELEKSDCAALRNNLVVAMTDFCVHYTAMIECYIPKITKRLRDPCEVVRRQTFILLSRLLQRDYVKWRGVLFLRFLLSLVDESEKIRRLADFLFGNILKVKAPLLAYNSFVEAIYVLNDCHAHNGHNNSDAKQSRTKDQAFSIRGNDERARSKRMQIYVTLLKQMAPEHLLATFAKLCAEVLAAASDGMLNIEDVTGQSVLQDAFQILACKEIRLSVSRGSSSETVEMEEEGGDSNAAAAKGRAITQAVRKGLIQNTIPIFIELKRLLESKNSPLTGSLMDCLRVLLKDYKNEIEEMLVADKQLQKELVYDMQKHEAAKARSMANQGVGCGTSHRSREPEQPATAAGREENVRDSGLESRVVSAAADAMAAKAARSVLREVNGGAATPPLSAMSVPKLRSSLGGGKQSGRPSADVLESLRRRPTFMSDDDN
ncbi:PREDICTED: condensin-2 complex subunit D3 [Brassica oleracea var. oleracea]|uniref:Condensin-2 complex subunit n=1 Tax=Brassica oleracea var. oleracea TaxID=109376 RepID=A0A0D3DEB1_BRAOL|nr:PREDICTED: condensin-2 complex subunit D3 [Brassica oleracea var. oleracea]